MWLNEPVKVLDTQAQAQAEARQTQLTKPAGSLGALERLAIRLAAMQGKHKPNMQQAWISVFAADHGLAETGVSAFPQQVTAQMVQNFISGGAAITVLARQHQAPFEVVDVGVKADFANQPGLVVDKVGYGTANALTQPAMTQAECQQALEVGKRAAERAVQAGASCFIGGEMGIANTASSSLLLACLMQTDIAPLVGAGTGLDSAGVQHKTDILQQVLAFHSSTLNQAQPLDILACVGGFEIAALAGAYLRCAQLGLPVLVDGVITTSAALVANAMAPQAKDWWIFSHLSVEPAHKIALDFLGVKPLLQLDLRLGEGSGAAIAWPLLQQACVLHNQMATFAEASVSSGA
ncbi:MAG: nicotinate-nucleotide--dimethylbenzimidazole phosphoribosyltransferase [Thiomicrospira sp.]|uniref:nicotinate-nucleotide--dimethylbenzimidazole phosphoribosyltransferase n=1 Tax=Thiomicrospira sp. TaxID=935 RepID=UPI0019EB2208|nr:nicotinate-nucleotide--dimethylbenzimidazole phosphoribosyltransferase [Thiomicrospira sp.]MBE0493957.1 nicotinate-nucleotide--dimethylbenzimidazole phosphoribosyltransferase [Thiomicrospira sp.]